MITEWIKMGLLLLSCFGYWEYFRSEHRVNVYFAPVYTIAVQFMVLFAAGILNFLKEAALLLYIAGFLLFLQAVCKNKKRVFSHYLNVGYLYFAVAFIAVGVAVHGKQFTQIDNFTHWAMVVKRMLNTNRFPAFQDTVIQFSTYPLGSAALLYYICRATSRAEYMQMWAQAFLMLCAILPVFACCRKNRGEYSALVAAMTGFLLHYNVPFTELLVDTLMPLAGMASVLFICFHCAAREYEVRHTPSYAIPLLVWTMNIKHAALLYVVVAIVVLFLCVRKHVRGQKDCLIVTGTVLLARMIWSRHCDYVFESVSQSMHSMSMDWFSLILGDKTKESIIFSVKRVIAHSIQRTEYLWILAWLLLLGLMVWMLSPANKKTYFVFLFSGVSIYAVYVIGVTAMYVFSMPEYELLAAFSRYMRSMDVAMYYMLTVFSGILLGEVSSRKLAGAGSAAMFVLTLAGWYWQTGRYAAEQLICCTEAERQECEQLVAEYNIDLGRSYLLCTDEKYPEWYPFPKHIWRYQLESEKVAQIVVTDETRLEIVTDYDYVIIQDEDNPIIEDWIQKNYPDQADRQVVQRFA